MLSKCRQCGNPVRGFYYFLLYRRLSAVIEHVPRVTFVFPPGELSLYFLRLGEFIRLFLFSVRTALQASLGEFVFVFVGLFLFGTAREFSLCISVIFYPPRTTSLEGCAFIWHWQELFLHSFRFLFSPSLFTLAVLASASDFLKIIFAVGSVAICLLQILTCWVSCGVRRTIVWLLWIVRPYVHVSTLLLRCLFKGHTLYFTVAKKRYEVNV